MQLNIKTASRNYGCCLAGSQRKPFKGRVRGEFELSEFELSGFYCISDSICVNMASVRSILSVSLVLRH